MVAGDALLVVHRRDARQPLAGGRQLAIVEVDHHPRELAVVGGELGVVERRDRGVSRFGIDTVLGQQLRAGQRQRAQQQRVVVVALEAALQIDHDLLEIRRGTEREAVSGIFEAAIAIVTLGQQLDGDADQQEHHEQRHAERDSTKQLAPLLGVDVPDEVAGLAVARIDHRPQNAPVWAAQGELDDEVIGWPKS